MSILASLVRAYDRMGVDVPAVGFSSEKISFLISLSEDGTPVGPPIDLRDGEGKKRTPKMLAVPQATKRASGIAPNFLWDKTSYTLGITAGDGKRTAEEHARFRDVHDKMLAGLDDLGLRAFLLFLRNWQPGNFIALGWPDDIKDQNIVFALESERRQNIYLHNRPAARELWSAILASGDKTSATCLVTGNNGPIARLHPAVKGVWGAQSAGASLVSFNLDAFTSYGHEQGENAPISEHAAFAYTIALNRFLEKDSAQRIQIGDASTVFWADASDAKTADDAQHFFAALLNPINETTEAKKVRTILDAIRGGRQPMDFKPEMPSGVRFYVLGLSPNAARLSVRFYIEDDFGTIAANFLAHVERLRIDPPPKLENPSLWRYLVETAMLQKSENIPPNLAGEFFRAILTGANYPRTLLTNLLMRMRADRNVNALRVSLLKALLIKNFSFSESEVSVSLDPHNKDPGYLLGRLFATYEYTQTQALGGNVNATIRDQYYGAASATPRAVFPLLQRKTTHHLSRLRKDRPGLAINLDRDIGEIFELAEADGLFVPTLTTQRQALFAIGYYHQRNKFYRGKDAQKGEAALKDTTEN